MKKTPTFYGHVLKRPDPPWFYGHAEKSRCFFWFSLYDPMWSETYFVKKSGQISRVEVKDLQRKEGIDEVL